jgi:hypothetical protein
MTGPHGHGRDPGAGKFGAVFRLAQRDGDPRI